MDLLRIFEERVHKAPLKERITHALYRLNIQREKLDHTSARLHHRDQEMFQRCVGATLSKDVVHAKLYANECAEMRKMAKIVLGSQLALERVALRLQTIEEFGDVLVQLAPVISIVRETKGRIVGIVPEVANELDDVHELLNDLTVEAGQLEPKSIDLEASNEEARKILEESTAIAEQQLKDRFPQLPTVESTSEAKIPIALTTGGESVSFESRLYDYIKSKGGELSLTKCAGELGSSPEMVREALDRLRGEGKIVFQ